jgi:hypothetical protein
MKMPPGLRGSITGDVRDGNQGNDTITIDLGSAQFFNSAAEDSFTILDGAASISLLQSNGVVSYSVSQSGITGGSNVILDYAQLQGDYNPDDAERRSRWRIDTGIVGARIGRNRLR